ncbi:hypothetical protein B0H14DRAFT_2568745 [Mycena olivaceomarginata]|nr:hypothetical protein B0H14DRAFT_2568745 [Mycena olivaceomarginata]
MTKCDHPVKITRVWGNIQEEMHWYVYREEETREDEPHEGIDSHGVHVELERGDKVLLREVGGALLREGHKRAARLPVELDGKMKRDLDGEEGRDRYGGREIWEGGQSDRREWMGRERQGMEGVRNGLWGRGWGGEGCGRRGSGDELACTTTEMVGGSIGVDLASGSISGDRMEGRGGNGTYGKRLRDTGIDAASSVVRLCAKNEIRLSALLRWGSTRPRRLFALSSTAGKLANWERRRVKRR